MSARYSLRSKPSSASADVAPSQKDASEMPSLPADVPLKRKREEDEAEEDAPAAKRVLTFSKHSRFWALDGNVVLRFGQIELKLHRSRLATQSPWFAKLFDQRAGMEVKVEDWEKKGLQTALASAAEENGCDVYSIDEDTCNLDDFVALLSAMDDAIEFFKNPPPFSTVASIYRAAYNLSCTRFEDYARDYLEEKYSDHLNHLDANPVPDPVAAIVLGRTWDLPRIVKRAFYELLRSTTAAGLVINDAPVSPDATLTVEDPESTAAKTDAPSLLKDDFFRLLDAQKRLLTGWNAALWTFPLDCASRPACMTPEEVHKAWKSIVQEVVVVPGRRDEVAHPAALDVFLGLDKLIDAMGTKGPDKDRLKFCRHCIAEQKYVFHEMQEKWWNSLDEWLNIATLEN